MKTLNELIEELQELAYQGCGDWTVLVTSGTGGLCTPSVATGEEEEGVYIS